MSLKKTSSATLLLRQALAQQILKDIYNRSLQPKSAGLPGITRQRVGLPLKIFRLNSLLLLLLCIYF